MGAVLLWHMRRHNNHVYAYREIIIVSKMHEGGDEWDEKHSIFRRLGFYFSANQFTFPFPSWFIMPFIPCALAQPPMPNTKAPLDECLTIYMQIYFEWKGRWESNERLFVKQKYNMPRASSIKIYIRANNERVGGDDLARGASDSWIEKANHRCYVATTWFPWDLI